MSETRADYLIDSDLRPVIDVYCSGCGTYIGHMVEVDGRTWLQVGALQIAWMPEARCECGKAFRYAASDRKLEQIIQDRLKRAQNG